MKAQSLRILLCMVVLALVGCGSVPRSAAPSSETPPVKLGPSMVSDYAKFAESESLDRLIKSAGEARSNTKTRGVNDKAARLLVLEGRALTKKKAYIEAIDKYERAQKVYPDEAHLLLIAATRHLLFKRGGERELCQRALMDWQLYLKHCVRCRSVTRFRDRAIVSANTLGTTCGTWTTWESEPKRGRLRIDGLYVGRTPQSLWLPSGLRQYEIKRAHLSDRGEVSLSQGREKHLKLNLIEGGGENVFTLTGQLKCLHGDASQAQLDRCAASMNTGDLFTVELMSDQDIFVYLFALSDQKLAYLFPRRGASPRASAMLGDRSMVLPQRNAWRVDDQSEEDELWLLASETPLELITSPEMEMATVRSMVERHSKKSQNSGHQDRVQAQSVDGVAFLRWVIREKLPAQN